MRTDPDAKALLEQLQQRGWTISTAESCTGGGIGHALTAIPGSSATYMGGIISYTNQVKHRLLGVPQETLDEFGAVSPQTAKAMAEGVCRAIGTDVGISATGLAGPEGDGSGKPVGLVYLGISCRGCTNVQELLLSGDREAVREQAVRAALQLLSWMETQKA